MQTDQTGLPVKLLSIPNKAKPFKISLQTGYKWQLVFEKKIYFIEKKNLLFKKGSGKIRNFSSQVTYFFFVCLCTYI